MPQRMDTPIVHYYLILNQLIRTHFISYIRQNTNLNTKSHVVPYLTPGYKYYDFGDFFVPVKA